MTRSRFPLGRLLLAIATVALVGTPSGAQEAGLFFQQNCASCHTIGGGQSVGPDLKDVSGRKDRAWLERFVQNPKAVIDSGDAYAAKLLQEARGVVMPAVPGLTPARAAALISLIEAESKLPRSKFAGTQVSDRPFTAKDVALGRQLFGGQVRLAAGGPACSSCHAMRDIGGLGGGRLGPDLTVVYERLQGRKGITGWLGNPASPVMQPIFAKQPLQAEEVTALVAYFEESARKGGAADVTPRLNFLLLGLGGTVLGLVGIDAIWKRRLHGVRRSLLEQNKNGGRG
jgi:mono/diheme cytochrome c family protein